MKGIPPYYTETYYKLPLLLYVDVKWSDEQRDDWFKLPHWQRLELLSARNGILSKSVPVMPITLVYEDPYPNMRVPEGLSGSVNLYYNQAGDTYVGFMNDMARQMDWFAGPTRTRRIREVGRMGFWQAEKADMGQFKARTGKSLAKKLTDFYQERRPESIYLFRKILKLAIQAHNDFVSNGAYTMEWDKDLGPKVVAGVRREMRQLEMQEGTGTRLDRLRRCVDSWGPMEILAVNNYKAAHRQGATALAWFMLKDEEWRELDEDQKEMVVEFWEIQEVAQDTQEDAA